MARWKTTTRFTSMAADLALTARGAVGPDAGAVAEEDTTEEPVQQPTEAPPVEAPDESEPPATGAAVDETEPSPWPDAAVSRSPRSAGRRGVPRR